VALLAAPTAAIIALIWTNDLHGWLWSDASLRPATFLGQASLALDRTPTAGYWASMAYLIAAVVIAGMLFVHMIAGSWPLYRWQTAAILVITTSLLAIGIYELDGQSYPRYLPLTYCIATLAMIWGLSYVRTGDLVALSRRLILERLNDPVIVLDEQDRVMHLNAAARQLIGCTQSRVVGHSLSSVWPAGPELAVPSTEPTRQEIALGQGSKRILDVYITPVSDSIGRLACRIAVLRDITDLKETEREKQALQAQILHGSKLEAMGTLASGIAHDFNNLLTAIHGNATLAKALLSVADPAYEEINEIEIACKRASRLTRQLLMFGRRQPTEPVPINLNTAVNEMLEMLERLIGENITISLSPAPDLWTTYADQGNIEQVIINLVVNARDAMPSGGRITIETHNVVLDEVNYEDTPDAYPGKFVCLSVIDTGKGMDETILRRIFEPFFSTKQAGRGTGLGLAVVDTAVKVHGGWIEVQSQVDQGSTFSIYLPADETTTARTEREGEEPIDELQGRGERILFVEDAQNVREFAVRVLRENGYEVTAAADVQSALETLDRVAWQIDLVLTDVVLPDRTGIELAVEVLARENGPRVLLSSGYTGPRSQWETIHDRAWPFLQKPYSLHDLLRTIREVLESA
jgi:PAS domain S-box-containing protein